MRRETWRLMIQAKGFYVGTYRFLGTALACSVVCSVLLSLAIFYVYLHMPERHYYATNGEVPPSELTAMEQPNDTAVPLLADDPAADDEERLIPE